MKLSPVQTKREAMGGGGCWGFIDVLLGFAAEDTCACASCALHGTFQVRLPNTRRCMCLCPMRTSWYYPAPPNTIVLQEKMHVLVPAEHLTVLSSTTQYHRVRLPRTRRPLTGHFVKYYVGWFSTVACLFVVVFVFVFHLYLYVNFILYLYLYLTVNSYHLKISTDAGVPQRRRLDGHFVHFCHKPSNHTFNAIYKPLKVNILQIICQQSDCYRQCYSLLLIFS